MGSAYKRVSNVEHEFRNNQIISDRLMFLQDDD